jgi:hypothetical protein
MRMIRVFVLAVAVAGLVLALGCASALAAPETPELKVTFRGMESATLVGTLNPSGFGEEGTYEFLYSQGTSCEGGHVRSGVWLGFPHEVEQVLSRSTRSRLNQGTEYTACLVDRNTLGESATSAPVTFRTTSPSEAPEAPELFPASGVSNSSATLEGVLNPHSSIPIRWFFEYAKGATCSGSETTTSSLTPPVEVSLAEEEGEPGRPPVPRTETVEVTVSGLQRGTLYTYCLIAENGEEKEMSSAPMSFATSALGPSVSGESVSDVGSTSAVLEGRVNPNGSATSYFFQYGTSSAYGSSTPSESVGTGSQAVGLQARLEELTPETTYHFRVVATNEDGEIEDGPDSTFSTDPMTAPGLPDGRAYELVSSSEDKDLTTFEPEQSGVGKHHGFGFFTFLPVRAAANGEAFAYLATSAPTGGNGSDGEEEGGVQWLARRGPADTWSAAPIQPGGDPKPRFQSFSSDLSTAILDSPEPLIAGLPETGYNVVYADALSEGALSPLFTTTSVHRGKHEEFKASRVLEGGPGGSNKLAYAGASADMSHLLFEANDALTATAETLPPSEEEDDLYDSVGGRPYLVNVLPGGMPAPDATFGFTPPTRGPADVYGQVQPNFDHVISSDGSRIFWTDLTTGALFVRENDTAETERCAIPQPAGESCTAQISGASPAQYLTAAADGRYVVYSEGGELYRFDVETGERETLASQPYSATGTGELTVGSEEVSSLLVSGGSFAAGQAVYGPGIPADTFIQRVAPGSIELTRRAFAAGRVSIAAGGAEVQGLLGASEEASYIYFAAGGALTSGAHQHSCEGSPTEEELCNLYALHIGEGGPRLIAVAGGNAEDEGGASGYEDAGPIAGDWQPDIGDRTSFVTPDGLHLVFLSQRSLTGFPIPGGDRDPEVYMYDYQPETLTCVSCNPRGTPELGHPGGAGLPVSWSNTFQHRIVSSDGDRVFFNSEEALVPQDKNGKLDAYEWERDGTGSCTNAPGCINLLSEGTSTANSYFIDASENGDDVFIESRAELAPQDKGEQVQVFDAHVCTSEAPCPRETTLSCTGTGCQGVPSAPPSFATPSSVTFNGPGNFPPLAPPKPPKPKPPTRAQKLAKALRDCKKHRSRTPHKRCERQARKRYGPTKADKAAREGRPSR